MAKRMPGKPASGMTDGFSRDMPGEHALFVPFVNICRNDRAAFAEPTEDTGLARYGYLSTSGAFDQKG